MEDKSFSEILTISDRKKLTMNGVTDIVGFDNGVILLDTAFGRVYIEGEELKIESLDKSGGNITVNGNISGVFCNSHTVKKGFFGKIFG